jgi:hypothetical protein
LITEPCWTTFVLGLYAIHGSIYFTDLCTFMSYDLASRRIIFQDGCWILPEEFYWVIYMELVGRGDNVLGKRKPQNQILHVLLMYC